uniref:C-type lectin domain-containing protein n=1 Tax=Panagrellus redivivus TaxID=6233 RepID=A0A7E4V5A0_PANRE
MSRNRRVLAELDGGFIFLTARGLEVSCWIGTGWIKTFTVSLLLPDFDPCRPDPSWHFQTVANANNETVIRIGGSETTPIGCFGTIVSALKRCRKQGQVYPYRPRNPHAV